MEALREKLIDAIDAEFITYYYTSLRMHLAGKLPNDIRGDPGDAPYSTNRRLNDSV